MRFILTSSLFFGLLLFLSLLAKAVDITNYNTDQGLIGNEVYCVFSDSRGFLWFGTNLGVSRFDGKDFINYDVSDGLPDNDVFVVSEDHEGRIWFGAYSPELTYIENDSIHQYKYNEVLSGFIRDKSVKLGIKFLDGNILLADRRNALLKIDEQGSIEIIGDKECNIYDFGEDVLTSYGKSQDRWKRDLKKQGYRLFDGVNGFSVLDSSFSDLVENQAKGSHYALKTKRGNYILTKGDITWNITKDTSYFRVGKYYQDCIYQDKNERVWIGTHGKGVFVLADENLNDTILHILDGQTITDIENDFQGGIWLTSLSGGVFHIPFLDYEKLQKSALPSMDIVQIEQGPNNSLFLVFENHEVWHGQGRNWTKISNEMNPISRELAYVKYDQDNKTLFLKSEHAPLINPTDYKIKKLRLRDEVVPPSYLYFAEIYQNRLLEIRGRGLYWEDERQVVISDRKFYASNRIFNVIEYADTLWFSTREGIYFLQNDELLHYDHPSVGDQHVVQMIFDVKKRIIVTENDRIIIEGKEQNRILTFKDGLPNGIIKCILDESDVLWIASATGLYYFDFNNASFVKKISSQQGLLGKRVNAILSVKDKLFVASKNGLVSIRKEDVLSLEILPPRLYAKVEFVNGEKWFGSTLNFSYKQNNLDINLTSISYTDQDHTLLQWKFEGIDKDWKESKSNVLSFSSLLPGSYKLMARSSNIAGIWSDVISLEFEIKPAFWQRTSFYITLTLLAFALAFLVFYLRTRALKIKNKKDFDFMMEKSELEIRALRAQMNPHFVFNSLTSIQYLINAKKNDEAEFYLDKFSRLLRLIVDQAGYAEISLLNEIDLLRIYIDLENLRYEDKFDFGLEVDDGIELETVLIPGMLLQPFVENSIEHGLSKKEGKGHLFLNIKKVDSSLVIVIEDDGIGRKKAEQLKQDSGKSSQSVGVYNVKRRIELLSFGREKDRFNFEIEDLTDEKGNNSGTKIKLTIPFKLS